MATEYGFPAKYPFDTPEGPGGPVWLQFSPVVPAGQECATAVLITCSLCRAFLAKQP